MKTEPLKHLTEANQLPRKVTISMIADPLLNIDHNQRVPLTLDKKQCGTFIPLVLFIGMKLRYLCENNLEEEPEDGVDRIIQASLRQILMEIRKAGDRSASSVYYGKTLQEKVFRHLVFNEPLKVDGSEDLLTSSKKNKAHTVSNGTVQGENPSFTVPCYLCRYLLEKEGLNPGSDFNAVNPALKRYAKDVYSKIKQEDKDTLNNAATFSRRVQNAITLDAFKDVFGEVDIEIPVKHPYF